MRQAAILLAEGRRDDQALTPRSPLRRARGDERSKTIAVVMLTSSKEEQDIVASRESGVNSYVLKLVDCADISAAAANVALDWMLPNRPPTGDTRASVS